MDRTHATVCVFCGGVTQGRAVDIVAESGEQAARRAADERVSDGLSRVGAAFTPAFQVDHLREPNNGLT